MRAPVGFVLRKETAISSLLLYMWRRHILKNGCIASINIGGGHDLMMGKWETVSPPIETSI